MQPGRRVRMKADPGRMGVITDRTRQRAGRMLIQVVFPDSTEYVPEDQLDEEAGAKLSLIFRLQERVADLDRVELIAWRIARFTREEAIYWLSRMTRYGPEANRWDISGLRILLGGTLKDARSVERMLGRLRA